ncbi:hypothetical protein ACS0TY_034629 [Phlomoides rotata]
MKVDAPPSGSSYTDDDQNNLKQLLEAFSSVVSLEDIASAYCETGRNLISTAEMLRNMPSSNSRSSCSNSQVELENTTDASSQSSSNRRLDNTHTVKMKSKKSSASAGSVSDMIVRNYIRYRPQLNESNEKSKPVKLNSDDFPESAIWGEKKGSASTSREPMNKDIGEFVYEMLGDVYQLDKSVIQDIIGQSGYNIPMSMDKLFDLSAATLEKSDDVIGVAARNTMKNSLDVRSMSCEKKSPFIQHSGSGDELIFPGIETKKKDIQREVLESLFTARDRSEGMQEFTNPVRRHRQSPYGRNVAKPLEETVIEDFTFITTQSVSSQNAETILETYEELRDAVVENWVTAKQYCIASVEAFMKEDYETSQNLREESYFFMRKAREADEKSAKKLTEGSDEDEEFSINMHFFEPREALHQMKLHLKSLSGLPSIHYLKAVVGTDGGDKKDGRRKTLITKLLGKEGIPWSEEGNGWTISIRVDEIDPKKLSFAKDE